MATKTEKMTIVKALTYALDNCSLPDDVREKFEDMRTKASKKNGAEGGTSEVSALNAEVGEAVISFMVDGKEYLLNDLIANVMAERFDDPVSSSKASAVMKPLVDTNRVIKGKTKGKVTYRLAKPGEVNAPKE